MKCFEVAISDIVGGSDILKKSNHSNLNVEPMLKPHIGFDMPIMKPKIIAVHFILRKRNFNYQFTMPIGKE